MARIIHFPRPSGRDDEQGKIERFRGFFFNSLVFSISCGIGVLIILLGILLSSTKGFIADDDNASTVAAAECDPPPQRDAPPTKGEHTYTVRKGDTLFLIAQKWAPDLPPQEAMGALRLRNQHRLADWQGRCERYLAPPACSDVVFAGGKLILPRRPKR